MVDPREIDVTPEDVPFLLEAAKYCRVRGAMAWGDKEKARLARLATWNETLAEKGLRGD